MEGGVRVMWSTRYFEANPHYLKMMNQSLKIVAYLSLSWVNAPKKPNDIAFFIAYVCVSALI